MCLVSEHELMVLMTSRLTTVEKKLVEAEGVIKEKVLIFQFYLHLNQLLKNSVLTVEFYLLLKFLKNLQKFV